MSSRTSTSIFSLAFAMALMVFAAPVAQAQEAPVVPDPPVVEEAVEEAAAAAVNDEELTSFARAYAQIQQISTDAQSAAAAAETPEEAQAAQLEAQAAMEAAVSAQGLTPEQYAGIGEKVNADPALQARVAEIIEQDGF